jgi:hypothetical protein
MTLSYRWAGSVLLLLLCQTLSAQQLEGFWRADLRWYPHSADVSVAECCDDLSLGVTWAPRFRHELSENWRLNLEPYVRLESDGAMSHLDLRQANMSYHALDWYLLFGFNEVYWGVTETYQPVNIVNQYDGHIGPQVTDKLGQPMLQFRYFPLWGELQLIVMPYHRDRPYRDPDQRLALDLPVDTDATYPDGKRQPELAARLAGNFGALDVAFAGFHGNSREAVLVSDGDRYLKSYHDLTQLSVDAQWTGEDLLLKAEIARKWEGSEAYYSSVVGFEQSFYGFSGTDATLGLVLEHSYDNRPTVAPPTLYDNDLFTGLRWSSNNISGTEWLVAGIYDVDTGSQVYKMEASSRLNERLKIVGEAWWFSGLSEQDPAHYLHSDSYISLGIESYF